MTTYRYMGTRSISGYCPVSLEYRQTTPLGDTFQYETILVQAYSAEEAKKKAQSFLRKSVAECIAIVEGPETSIGGYATTSVEVAGDIFSIPTDVYNKIVTDAQNKMVANGIEDYNE